VKKQDTPVAGIIMILAVLLIALVVVVLKYVVDDNEKQAVSAQAAAAGEVLNASHILIGHSGENNERTKDEAIKLAMQISMDVRANPDIFGELAAKYSDGPSKSNGGKLGNFPPEKMVAPFSAAVQKLKIGEVSDPVATQFGFHVILRLEPN
jgi:parvulin-like peptidyl-prolyl isomerase